MHIFRSGSPIANVSADTNGWPHVSKSGKRTHSRERTPSSAFSPLRRMKCRSRRKRRFRDNVEDSRPRLSVLRGGQPPSAVRFAWRTAALGCPFCVEDSRPRLSILRGRQPPSAVRLAWKTAALGCPLCVEDSRPRLSYVL